MFKRFITLVITLVIALSVVSPAFAAESSTSFSDVPANHWAASYIEKAVKAGIMSGTGNGKFDPDREVTLVEFGTMIINQFFQDELAQVPATGAWYEPYMKVASKLDLYSGKLNYTIDMSTYDILYTYDATRIASRYDVADIIVNRIAGKLGWSIHVPGFTPDQFADVASIPADMYNTVWCVCAAHIMNGVSTANGVEFAGDMTLTRAQAAVILCNLRNRFVVQAEGLDVTVADCYATRSLNQLPNGIELNTWAGWGMGDSEGKFLNPGYSKMDVTFVSGENTSEQLVAIGGWYGVNTADGADLYVHTFEANENITITVDISAYEMINVAAYDNGSDNVIVNIHLYN